MNGDFAHSELLMLIRNAIEEIERTKQRQWRDFYNIMLTQGALVGFYHLDVIHNLHRAYWLNCVFIIAAVVLAAVGCMLIAISQVALSEQRNLVEQGYYPGLDRRNQEILNSRLAASSARRWYPWFFAVLNILAAVFVLLVVLGLAPTQK